MTCDSQSMPSTLSRGRVSFKMATVNRLPDDDQGQMFLNKVEQNVRNCARILGTPDRDEDSIRAVIKSLETMERQIGRVVGNLLSKEQGMALLQPVQGLTAEGRSMLGREREKNSFLHGQKTKPNQLKETKKSLISQNKQEKEDKIFTPAQTSYSAPTQGGCSQVSSGQLELLAENDFKGTEMAESLNVSQRTIWRKLRANGISLKDKYADLTDEELDELVEEVMHLNQNIGADALRARLHDRGIKVQRQRVRESVARVDPVGVALRSLKPKMERSVYVVAAPNSWWHLDGNHKLIRYGIVIHGAIDGYSRMVTFLKAANNNKASTVLQHFLIATHTYGTPSRIRVDQGVENADICLIMNLLRGFDRASALRGPSVHNQRIERVWVDTWNGATHLFYKLFAYFEANGLLNIGDQLDLWILQLVYLPEVNKELEVFRGQWNCHGLSTEHGKSPRKLFLQGLLKNYNSDLVAVRDFFDRQGQPEPLQEIGSVTEEMVKAALGRSRVDVPDIVPPLSPAEQDAVKVHIADMSTKDFAVEKYLAARAFARQLLA